MNNALCSGTPEKKEENSCMGIIYDMKHMQSFNMTSGVTTRAAISYLEDSGRHGTMSTMETTLKPLPSHYKNSITCSSDSVVLLLVI